MSDLSYFIWVIERTYFSEHQNSQQSERGVGLWQFELHLIREEAYKLLEELVFFVWWFEGD